MDIHLQTLRSRLSFNESTVDSPYVAGLQDANIQLHHTVANNDAPDGYLSRHPKATVPRPEVPCALLVISKLKHLRTSYAAECRPSDGGSAMMDSNTLSALRKQLGESLTVGLCILSASLHWDVVWCHADGLPLPGIDRWQTYIVYRAP